MFEFKRKTNGFSYVFEKEVGCNEVIIVKMPPVSANKRGINDIGWQCDGELTLYGTLSEKPESDKALWQEISPGDEINKTVAAIKIVNSGASACRIIIRALLN